MTHSHGPVVPSIVSGPRRSLLSIAVLGACGTGIASYLTATTVSGAGAACFGLSDCNVVSASPYAHLAGVPVALVGALTFSFISAAAIAARVWPERLRASPLLVMLAASVAGSTYSVYLTIVSGAVLGAYCPWCLLSAGIMVLLAILSFRTARVN